MLRYPLELLDLILKASPIIHYTSTHTKCYILHVVTPVSSPGVVTGGPRTTFASFGLLSDVTILVPVYVSKLIIIYVVEYDANGILETPGNGSIFNFTFSPYVY